MNKQTEALKMAIEWMEKYHQMHIIEMGVGERWIDLSMAIQACKEALEQPAQEPVAWTNTDELEELKNDMTTCYMYKTPYGDEKDVALYTHPHQWQGLSDDEIGKIMQETHEEFSYENDSWRFARAIEQSLKEKNNVNS